MLDQELALEFVKTNIRAFHGDPDRITLVGEGVGSSSVGLHMISPRTNTDIKGSLLPAANVVCEGYVFTGVCLSTREAGIPACLPGHMTKQQYISRCTVDVSQLVWRQHTGNIKCMMG